MTNTPIPSTSPSAGAGVDSDEDLLPESHDDVCNPLRKDRELKRLKKGRGFFAAIVRRITTDDVFSWAVGNIQNPYERLAIRLEREIDALQRQKNRTLVFVMFGPVFALIAAVLGLWAILGSLSMIQRLLFHGLQGVDLWRTAPFNYIAAVATYAPLLFSLLTWGLIVQANIRDNLQLAGRIRDRRKAVTIALHLAAIQDGPAKVRLNAKLEDQLLDSWKTERQPVGRGAKSPQDILLKALSASLHALEGQLSPSKGRRSKSAPPPAGTSRPGSQITPSLP